MEILTPKVIEIKIQGKDKYTYLCKLTNTVQETRIDIDPMFSTTTSSLDLNDKEYLEFYLNTVVDNFIDRYRDNTTMLAIKNLKKLLEDTTITNHFDYIAFSEQALSIVNFILEHPPSKV